MSCERSITFTIPGAGGSPDVIVTVVEVDGQLAFTLGLSAGAGANADLRGLFFDLADDAKLAGLTYTGSDITDFDTVNVVDLGQGANMNGTGLSYDVGLEIGTVGTGKDTIQSLSFTLSNAAGNLTLDDIAHMDFGVVLNGQRMTIVAPAAPDAVDDALQVFEDGQAGFDAPSATPQGVLLQVLANDTDADGEALTITHVEGALHGTLQIVDGDDADDLAGDAILYTPDADFAGTETLSYCISDGHGGTDSAHAQVTVNAVADTPDLDVQVLATEAVNVMRIVVTATASDGDGSEIIDRIVASGLPAGATLTPVAGDPAAPGGQMTQEYMLTLPSGTDSHFDLVFSAFAKETSNGDEQEGTRTLTVEMQHEGYDVTQSFSAEDQSLWSAGDAYKVHDKTFIGLDESIDLHSPEGDFFWYDYQAGIKAGFTQEITLEGGEIDAEISYDISVDTLHNKMTDQLLISSSALVAGGAFTAHGPEGAYDLDFDFNYWLKMAAGIDPGVEINFLPGLDFSDTNHVDILSFDSQQAGIDLSDVVPGLTGAIAWPHLDYAGGLSGSASSTDILSAQLDVDEFIYGGHSPFDIEFDVGVAWGDIELMDIDLWASIGLAQSLAMQSQGLSGQLVFEDGSTQWITLGQDLVIENASAIDAAGDHDGTVEFAIEFVPTVDLHNQTDVVGQVGYSVDFLKVQGGYDVGFDAGSIDEGPALHADGVHASSSNWYDETFALSFESRVVEFGDFGG